MDNREWAIMFFTITLAIFGGFCIGMLLIS